MGEIWFIRHGESLWNAEGRWQGQADPPLSERGRQQAGAVAEALAGAAVALLVASDLSRARQSAEIIGARIGVQPHFDRALRELDVGRWSGHSPAEVARRWPEELARFRAGDLEMTAGGAESRRALRARVGPALEAFAARATGPLVVVSHLGVLRAFRHDAVLEPGAILRLGSLAELLPLAERAPDGQTLSSGRVGP